MFIAKTAIFGTFRIYDFFGCRAAMDGLVMGPKASPSLDEFSTEQTLERAFVVDVLFVLQSASYAGKQFVAITATPSRILVLCA